MKFNRLSPNTDFISKFQSQLQIISGNVLYLTHEVDKVHKIVSQINNSINLQSQVDDFFEKDKEDIPEVENGNRSSN